MNERDTLELYLRKAMLRAKEVRACFDNRASKEKTLETIDYLIGYLEGGWLFVAER